MLSANEAESIILALVSFLGTPQNIETVPLLEATGRVLAETVTSPLDFPHWDNSAMDGYAVRHADVQIASPEHPITLEVATEIRAGQVSHCTLHPGQAARIFTGAPLPSGADTIVMQEVTQRQGDHVQILQAPTFQAYVRHQGTFHRAGMPLLQAGIQLQGPEIAILAAAQQNTIPVYRRPRVALISTGAELVPPSQALQVGQIVDSNQYALAALIQQMGAVPLPQGIVPDDPVAIQLAITQSIATADMVLSSGGVSVGDYDYVMSVLETLGAEIHIQAVAVKPGKPLTVATVPVPGKPPVLYFGLPGNPVSALVSFWRFVKPALNKLSGLAQRWGPVWVEGRSPQNLQAGGQRETYLWGWSQVVDGRYEFKLAGGNHSSGNLINLAQTNSLAVVPQGTRLIPAGDPFKILITS